MKRYALCIGNDDYAIMPKLNCAVADAEAVYSNLLKLDFEAELSKNLDNDSLAKKLSSFSDILKDEDYEAALLYYAGHGFQINGDNLLVPVDFDLPVDEKLAKRSAFALDDLMHWLNKYPEKTKVIILDACRNTYSIRGISDYFIPVTAPQGSIIAFSTSPGQTAIERDGHGLYTQYLLDHMSDPRISIETMFKRVRTDLSKATGGRQIPWEHTSLIGDFVLKLNVTYAGENYSDSAIADTKYYFDKDSEIAEIVDGLKSYNWYVQSPAMGKLHIINYSNASDNDLFVLGRNIYQAACGNCFSCIDFIDDFENIEYIPDTAKEHIINGMAFEIYYDSNGKLRKNLKSTMAESVISILETEPFTQSRRFIATRLLNENQIVPYIPGQKDKVQIDVFLEEYSEGCAVSDIKIDNKSIYFDDTNGQPLLSKETNCIAFEADLRKTLAIMPGYSIVEYHGIEVNSDSTIWIPNKFNLYSSDDDEITE